MVLEKFEKEVHFFQGIADLISEKIRKPFPLILLYMALLFVPLFPIIAFLKSFNEFVILLITILYLFLFYLPLFTLISYNTYPTFLSKSLKRLSGIDVEDVNDRKDLLDEIDVTKGCIWKPTGRLKEEYTDILEKSINERLKEIAMFAEPEEIKEVKPIIAELSENIKNKKFEKIRKNCLKIWKTSEKGLEKYKVFESTLQKRFFRKMNLYNLIATVIALLIYTIFFLLKNPSYFPI